METLQVTQIQRAETLEALNRSEIDIQISTAKKFPRSVEQSTKRIMALATIDEETAQECFYSLRRGKGESASAVEGPSVRLAEIVAASWGNLSRRSLAMTASSLPQEVSVTTLKLIPQYLARYREGLQTSTARHSARICK